MKRNFLSIQRKELARITTVLVCTRISYNETTKKRVVFKLVTGRTAFVITLQINKQFNVSLNEMLFVLGTANKCKQTRDYGLRKIRRSFLLWLHFNNIVILNRLVNACRNIIFQHFFLYVNRDVLLGLIPHLYNQLIKALDIEQLVKD